jgi:hypothetical protein
MAKAKKKQFYICVDNTGYEASLERRKIYQAVSDAAAARLDLIRIVDESGESYLYPDDMFVSVSLTASVRKAVMQAA